MKRMATERKVLLRRGWPPSIASRTLSGNIHPTFRSRRANSFNVRAGVPTATTQSSTLCKTVAPAPTIEHFADLDIGNDRRSNAEPRKIADLYMSADCNPRRQMCETPDVAIMFYNRSGIDIAPCPIMASALTTACAMITTPGDILLIAEIVAAGCTAVISRTPVVTQ